MPVSSTTTFLPFPLPFLPPFASPPPPSFSPSASSHAGPLCHHLPPLSLARSTILHLSSTSIPATFGLLSCWSPQPPPSFTLLRPLCHPPPLLHLHPRCLRFPPMPSPSTTTFLPSPSSPPPPFASPPPPSWPPSVSSCTGPLSHHLPPLSFTPFAALHLSSTSIFATFGLLSHYPLNPHLPPLSFTPSTSTPVSFGLLPC